MSKQRCCILCLTFLLVSTAHAANTPTFSRPVEIRAVWVDRGSIPKTEQGIRDLIRTYARSGINLVHPEVIFNGYSAYPSSYLTQKDLWNGLDMLGIMIDEAHKNHMEVHPWVWAFRCGYTEDRGGILPTHPDWAMLDRDGKDNSNGGYWLSPAHKSVRTLLLHAYEELVRKYPIDGIELDYVRFPSPDFGYEPLSLEQFQSEYGVDPLKIEPLTKQTLDWHLWRENLINTFVRDVSNDLKRICPELKISAAVASSSNQSRLEYLQDWEYWAMNSWVDFLAPMDYTNDYAEFMKQVESAADRVPYQALFAPGIGLQVQKGAKPMLDQVDYARFQPVSGVTLFATAYLDADRLRALREGPFRDKAELPFRRPAEKAKVLLSSAGDKLREGAPLGDLVEAQSEIESAKKLLDQISYRRLGLGRSVQTAPFSIPDKIVPIPETRVPFASSAPDIDGKLDDVVWQNAAKITLDYTAAGGDAVQPTEVYLAYDAQNLYVAYRSHERRMGDIKAKVAQHDGAVFYEDSAEFFLDTQGQATDYYQFAMNTLGTKYEAHLTDEGFNADWQGASATESDAWTSETAIPFSAVKVGTPSAGAVWRANFCRNRAVNEEGPNAEKMCWSPTYGSFHTPSRFGRLVFAERAK